MGEKQLRRIGDLVHAAFAHREDADLVDAAEAVLVRAHDPVLAALVALEVQHRIDEVLEQTRAGDRAVFGHVADEHGRAARALGELHQRLRAVADLRDAPGVRLELGQRDRLDRVDDEHRWPQPLRACRGARAGSSPRTPGRRPRPASAVRAASFAPPTLRRRRTRPVRRRARAGRRSAAAASTCRPRAARRAAPGCPERGHRRAAGRTRRSRSSAARCAPCRCRRAAAGGSVRPPPARSPRAGRVWPEPALRRTSSRLHRRGSARANASTRVRTARRRRASWLWPPGLVPAAGRRLPRAPETASPVVDQEMRRPRAAAAALRTAATACAPISSSMRS